MSVLAICSFSILLTVPLTNTSPVKIMEWQPIILSAPISQIQWNFRGNWRSDSDPEEPDPRSYHVQRTRYNDNVRRKENSEPEKLDESTESDYPEDQTMLPNLMEYSVVHSKSFGARPKALHISVEPSKDENVPKLQFNDSLLDAIKKLATTEAPRRPPTTVKRTRKPTPTTRKPKPKPQDKPRPKPAMDDPGKQVDDVELPAQHDEDIVVNITETSTMNPGTTVYSNNVLYGSSQVGNRESQMVIKPTVIVNFRGTVSNTDRDISLESRSSEDDFTNGTEIIPQGVFNINQEVNIDRTFSMPGEDDEEKPCKTKPRLDVNVIKKKAANEGNNGEVKIQASIKPDDTSKTNNYVKKYRMSYDFRNVEEETREYLPKQYYVVQLGPLAGFINFKHS